MGTYTKCRRLHLGGLFSVQTTSRLLTCLEPCCLPARDKASSRLVDPERPSTPQPVPPLRSKNGSGLASSVDVYT
jgi:hypothetical protein